MGKEKEEREKKLCIICSLKEIFQNIVRHSLYCFGGGSIIYDGVGLIKGKSNLIFPFLTLLYCIKYWSALYHHDMLNKIKENIMIWQINIFNVCLFLSPETELLCLNIHSSCGVNASTIVGDIRNIIKSSVTSPMFVCSHVVMAPMIWMVLKGRLYWMAYKGCSHSATNLGSHRAQTWWLWYIHLLHSTYKAYMVVLLLLLTNQEPFRPSAQYI